MEITLTSSSIFWVFELARSDCTVLFFFFCFLEKKSWKFIFQIFALNVLNIVAHDKMYIKRTPKPNLKHSWNEFQQLFSTLAAQISISYVWNFQQAFDSIFILKLLVVIMSARNARNSLWYWQSSNVWKMWFFWTKVIYDE